MDMRYVEFAFSDPFFYDRLGQGQAAAAPRPNASRGATLPYRINDQLEWTDWRQGLSGGWRHVSPDGAELPEQGWKLHTSATRDNAQEILEQVSGYCGRNRIAFKFLPTPADLLRNNLKYAGRGGSGKFITIYPVDEQACERILTDLDALIGGMAGPYILSDLRWNDGPLYLRYGGFRQLHVRDGDDQLVPAIRRPDGELVPDLRKPAFTPPDWVELPPFVQAAKQRLAAGGEEPFPYRIKEALHFSNGGGVYLAEDSDGVKVVLKEARPHAGLAPDGRSAVERLERERDYLEQLRALPAVVDGLGYFQRSGHHFLVQEHVAGNALNKEMVMRQPMIQSGTTAEDRAAYRDWALDLLAQVETTVTQMHRAGLVYGDLHPNNVLVTPDGRARFIDLEMAYPIGDLDAVPAGAPGFMAPDGRTGPQADLYSLACLKISMFVPLTVLLPLDEHKANTLVAEVVRQFELPAEFATAVLAQLRGGAVDSAVDDPGWSLHLRQARNLTAAWAVDSAEAVQALEAAITRGIWESLDLSRADRVFPGDIRQFSENALGIAHGACGNLLAAPGNPEQREAVLDWVEDALPRMTEPTVGFYNGITGIAHTMRRFGRHDRADRLYADVCGLPFEQLTGDLYGGLAGIGLDLLGEYADRSDGKVLDAVHRIRTVLRDRAGELGQHVRDVDGMGTVATGKGGLLFGATGQALFWLNSYESFGDAEDLAIARQALAADLAACVDCPDGSVQLNEGWRTLPYLGSGSIGVAMTGMRLLAHADDPDLRQLIGKVVHMARADFCVQSSLFNGRAGIVTFLAAVQNSEFASGTSLSDLAKHTRALGLHALVHGTGIHFPGEQLLRASVDWASGSAGVLTGLRAYAEVVHGQANQVPAPLPGLLCPIRPDDNARAKEVK